MVGNGSLDLNLQIMWVFFSGLKGIVQNVRFKQGKQLVNYPFKFERWAFFPSSMPHPPCSWCIPCLPSLTAPNTALTSFLGHLAFVTQPTPTQYPILPGWRTNQKGYFVKIILYLAQILLNFRMQFNAEFSMHWKHPEHCASLEFTAVAVMAFDRWTLGGESREFPMNANSSWSSTEVYYSNAL